MAILENPLPGAYLSGFIYQISHIPIDFDMYKVEADGLMKLEVWWLARQFKGRAYHASSIVWGNEHLRVNYEFDLRQDTGYRPELRISYAIKEVENKKDIGYPIYLYESVLHFGGIRYWFACPLYRGQEQCARRVGTLYFNGRYFGCRHCLDLTYQSKSANYSSSGSVRLHSVDWYVRAQKLQESMKRETWRGKETRKKRQLLKLYRKMSTVKW